MVGRSGRMTDRDHSTKRGAAERRELEAAGWEPKGRGAKTIWESPTDGRWYADYQAAEMQRKGERCEATQARARTGASSRYRGGGRRRRG